MLIGGLQKFSLLDYPGLVAAIVFTQGCNFRCQFCYNPMLVRPGVVGKFKNKPKAGRKSHPLIIEGDFFDFLKMRLGKLDGVVISGGEPTQQADLPEFLSKIKQLGYKIKLDTNGTNPTMLKKLIKRKLLDYLAMDIKAGEDKYEEITSSQVKLSNIKKSIKIIKESGLPYEFRTTIVPGLHIADDVKKIGAIIKGAEKWYLQTIKSDTDLVNPKLKNIKPYTKKEMEELRKIGAGYVKECGVR